MCAIHMLWKTGTVCLRLVEPHFIFDRMDVRTIRTYMCNLLTEDLALALKQVLSLCPIPLLPLLLIGGCMYRNSTSGRTINLAKQWVFIIKCFVIRVNNSTPPPLCTPHHEPILGVIYHLFSKRISEISLVLQRPSDDLLCQPYIDHINHRKIYIELLRSIFSTQLFSMSRLSWRHLFCLSNFLHAL